MSYELANFFFLLVMASSQANILSVLLFSQEVLTAFPCQFGMENMSGWHVRFYTGTALPQLLAAWLLIRGPNELISAVIAKFAIAVLDASM